MYKHVHGIDPTQSNMIKTNITLALLLLLLASSEAWVSSIKNFKSVVSCIYALRLESSHTEESIQFEMKTKNYFLCYE